jgi:hypothetical protein
VERTVPHTNSPLLELPAFQVPSRLLSKPGTEREVVLGVIDSLIGPRVTEVRAKSIDEILNPKGNPERRKSLDQTLHRLVQGTKRRQPELVKVRRGVYRQVRD